MQRTAACTMTATHCWQCLQSGPLCGHSISVGFCEQAAEKALSARGNSHPTALKQGAHELWILGLIARGYVAELKFSRDASLWSKGSALTVT
eukprot:1078640-Pelagomonas_calceolata.AAC.1